MDSPAHAHQGDMFNAIGTLDFRNRCATLLAVVPLTWISLLILSLTMSPRRHVALLVSIFTALLVAGCVDNPVGRICDLGSQMPAATEVVVASPSLDCVSRTCLRVPLGQQRPLHRRVQQRRRLRSRPRVALRHRLHVRCRRDRRSLLLQEVLHLQGLRRRPRVGPALHPEGVRREQRGQRVLQPERPRRQQRLPALPLATNRRY